MDITDPYPLSPSAVRHRAGGCSETGWSVRLRLPWFRALPMSGIERIVLSLEGQAVSESALLIRIDGRTHRLADLRAMSERYWSIEEDLQVEVAHGHTAASTGTVVNVELTLRMPDGKGHDGDWQRRTVYASTELIDPYHSRWPLGVCTFSFAGELRRGRSVRSCLQKVSALGGYTALEVLGAQVIQGYPTPGWQWLDQFADMARASGLVPLCYDGFLDPGRRMDGGADDIDVLRWAHRELSIAAALGCSYVRLNVPPDLWLFERLAAAAERRNLAVLTELHAQAAHDPGVQEILAVLAELQSSRLGLILDLSCVMQSLPAGWVDQVLRPGGPHEAAQIIETGWREGLPLRTIRARLADLGLPPDSTAARLADRTFRLFRRSDTSWLPEVLPHVRIVHGKFFEVAAGDEPTIAYGDVLGKLSGAGFDGHIMSEYEGHLWNDSADAFDQLSKHRNMISALSDV